jgi:hypothetical protein
MREERRSIAISEMAFPGISASHKVVFFCLSRLTSGVNECGYISGRSRGRSRRMPCRGRGTAAWVWLIFPITASIGIAVLVGFEGARPFLLGYVLLTWIVCIIAARLDARRKPARTGVSAEFVLINLAAFGLLILFLLPAVPTGRETSKMAACKKNFQSISMAFSAYHDQFGCFPPSPSNVSWRVSLLPYLGEQTLYAAYNQSQSWDSPANMTVARTAVKTYVCPANWSDPRDPEGRRLADYALVSGTGTIFDGRASSSLEDVRDGLTTTFLVVEASGLRIPWTSTRDADVDRLRLGVNLPGETDDTSASILSSYHAYGSYVMSADGSVNRLWPDFKPEWLRAHLTADAGDGPLPEIGDSP